MPLTLGFTSRLGTLKGEYGYSCVGPPKQGHLEKRGPKKKKRYVKALKWDESQVERVPKGSGDPSGQFTSRSGTGGTARRNLRAELKAGLKRRKRLTPSQQAMQAKLAEQEKKPVHQVKTPEEGVALILKGENVELQDTKAVHTILKKLGERAIAAKEAKKDAENFDPCLITVKGTSLFCSEKIKTKEFPHGIPRIEMPQFKTKHPIKGSAADKLVRNDEGEVDATSLFMRDLEMAGVPVEHHSMALARKLKASQAEMEGVKVAGMMLSPTRDPKKARIIVSKDDYVVDGHHTWAASVGRDAEDGNLDNDKEMEVVRIDLPMSEIYHLSVAWTAKMGLPRASVKKREYLAALLFGRKITEDHSCRSC